MTAGARVNGATDNREWDENRAAAIRRRRRLGPGVLGLSIAMVLATLLCSATPSAMAAPAAESSASCSPTQLDSAAWSTVLAVNSSRAVSAAVASPYLTSILNSLPNVTSLSFNSVYYDWNMSQAGCSVQLESVNVAFNVIASNTPGQVLVSESAPGYEVLSVTVQTTPIDNVAHQPDDLWTGEIFSLATQMSNPVVLAYWEVPYENYPSWGCTYWELSYDCDISPWAGLTATADGGAPNEGIAQAGTNTAIACVLPNFDCSRGFAGWYEFFPADPVNCLSVSPGNEVYSDDAYDGGVYYLLIYDLTTGQSCGSHQSMSMGPPNWAWVLAENVGDGLGGYLESPTYGSVNFENMAVGNDINIAPLYDGDDTQGYHMSDPTPAPPDYDTGPCAAIGSCFNIDQD